MYEGKLRAEARLVAKEEWKKDYYSNLPPSKDSRQVQRARVRRSNRMAKSIMNPANQGKRRRLFGS